MTALFADMVGFTAISERLGEEGTYALIQSVFEAMAGAVREQSGSVQDFAGDEIMAMFGVPDALENGPLLACRAALLIHERLAAIAPTLIAKYGVRPAVRIAINSGPVVVTRLFGTAAAPTALGDMVNLASRLQALAEPNSVLLSEATFSLVEGFVEATFAGSHMVKGKAEPQKVWRLDSIRQGATRFDVSVRHGLTAYVGRERELDILQRGFASARGVSGRSISWPSREWASRGCSMNSAAGPPRTMRSSSPETARPRGGTPHFSPSSKLSGTRSGSRRERPNPWSRRSSRPGSERSS